MSGIDAHLIISTSRRLRSAWLLESSVIPHNQNQAGKASIKKKKPQCCDGEWGQPRYGLEQHESIELKKTSGDAKFTATLNDAAFKASALDLAPS